MKTKKRKYLCWDDLADFYSKKTGGRARTKPMEEIYEWAIKQPEIKVNEDDGGSLYFETNQTP